MASDKTFATWAKERGIDDATFPHAESGYRIFSFIMFFVKLEVAIIATSFLSQLLKNWLDSKMFGSTGVLFEGVNLIFIKIPEIRSPLGAIFSLVSSIQSISTSLIIPIAVLIVILSIIYAIIAVMRWSCWERSCLSSDFASYRIKKKILDTTNASRRLSEAKRAANKSGGQDTNVPTVDAAAKVTAFKLLKKLRVRRHVRDTIDNTGLKVSERITLDMPSTEAERDALMALLKDFDKTLNRVEEGYLTFGDMLISTDYSSIEYKAEKVIEDPYDWEVDEDTGEAIEYWHAFPIDIVRSDADDTIEDKREEAMAWAEKTAASLDKMLTTKQSAVNRLSVTTSSTVALFRYEMSFQLEAKKFESMQESINQAFRTSGCTVRVDMGDLLISIPLPKNKTIPISIVSMYEEVFG